MAPLEVMLHCRAYPASESSSTTNSGEREEGHGWLQLEIVQH